MKLSDMQQITPPYYSNSSSSDTVTDSLDRSLQSQFASTCSDKFSCSHIPQKWRNSTFKAKCCIILSLLIVICSSIIVGIKAYNFVPIGDDLIYKFVLDDHTLWSNNITSEIGDLGDAIKSQYRQYFVTNGRTLVHILVHMFAGPWGSVAFGIFIGCVFGISMILLVKYTIPSGKRFNPIVWLFITFCLLYVQGPGILWSRLAAGINYLYPMALTLIYLLVYKRVSSSEGACNRPWIYPLLILLGFITGWSHECYCVPLSGAMFVKYCIILHKHKLKTVSATEWTMVVSLWIGSAILVFAPGNFIRVADTSSFINTIVKGIGFLLTTKMLWLVVVLFGGLAVFCKPLLKRIVKERAIDIMMLFFSIIFGIIANTGSWSFTGVSFFSMVVLLGGIGYIKLPYNYVYLSISLLGFVPLIAHQSRIIESMRCLKKVNEQFIDLYKESSSEVFLVPTVEIPGNVARYVYNWYKVGCIDEVLTSLNKCYYTCRNNAVLFNNDYQAYMGGDVAATSNDSVLSYNGEKYLWFQKEIIHKGDTLVLTHPPYGQWSGPIGWLRKLRRRNSNSAILPEKEYIILTDTTLLVGKGSLSGVKKNNFREIIDIKINANNPNEENIDISADV